MTFWGIAMDWRDRIVVNPEVLCGKPVIKGTRISVEFVTDLLAHGWTTDEILHEYDHLVIDDIRACVAFAAEYTQTVHNPGEGEG